MKKIFALCFVIFTLFNVVNVQANGLNGFEEKVTYQSGQFSDVVEGEWYENGIKTVYEKGIMNGTSDATFAPMQTLTWAQAVTIASRLSAVYIDKTLPEPQDLWYDGYVEYASYNNLLPTTHPETAEMENREITRQELSELFYRIFKAEDLPAINNKEIPDVDSINPEYKNAVVNMYAAGIITGKEGGIFDPENKTNRAEVATIISRLISPAERVGYDSKISEFMREQSGNFYNGGIAVSINDTTYYQTYETTSENVITYKIIARKDTGKTSLLYSSDKLVRNLSYYNESELVFVEGNELCFYNLNTNKKTVKYRSRGKIETYGIYDGKIYIFEEYTGLSNSNEVQFQIAMLDGMNAKTIIDGLGFSQTTYVSSGIHFFDDKMYICLVTPKSNNNISDVIYEIDLNTKSKKEILNISMKNVVFIESTIYYVQRNKDKSSSLMRANLKMISNAEKVADLPAEFSKAYTVFYANGKNMYYQSSSAQKIWQVMPNGKTNQIAELKNPNFEYSAINSQGIIMYLIKNLDKTLPNDVTVLEPDGTTGSYMRFLNEVYFSDENCEFEIMPDTIRDQYPEKNNNDIVLKPLRKYFTTDGDMVIEVSFENVSGLKKRINDMGVLIKSKSVSFDKKYRIYHEMDSKTETVFTFVIPVEVIGKNMHKEEIQFNFAFSSATAAR